jgi:hypothetical protein
VKADAGVALSTGPAAAACDVERHRYEVANLKILDVAASLDRLAGDLVSEPMPAGPVVRPLTMCWSEPQIFVVTTLRMTP